MKTIISLIFISLLFTTSYTAMAQEKMLTVEDAVWMNQKLYPVRVSQLQWLPESDYYVYAKKNSLYKVSARGGGETLLLTLDTLTGGMLKTAMIR